MTDPKHADHRVLDNPIGHATEDKLGFGEIAESLADSIIFQPNSTSFTLGLEGVWGSGKSSLLSLLLDRLVNTTESDGIGPVVLKFSPWLITNRAALVSDFFAQLNSAILQAEKKVPNTTFFVRRKTKKVLRRLGKGIGKFGNAVSVMSSAASYVDPTQISKVIHASSKAVSEISESLNAESGTLSSMKSTLSDCLYEIAKVDSSFRIVVLIDDLDRLDPQDTVEVLRLVKAVADFPAITYLLAYDRDVIADAITKSSLADDGHAYLEKIIQFSFKVPPLEPFQLRRWLTDEIDSIFPNVYEKGSERASAVLDHWAGRLLKTPRDIKRLLFAIRAVWPKLDGKADFLDFVWLQVVMQKASSKERDMYGWLVGYLQSLDAIAIGGSVSGMPDSQEKLAKILSSLGWSPYKNSDKSSNIDFHFLDCILAGVSESHLSESDEHDSGNLWVYQTSSDEFDTYREHRRLSSPWHWRFYFALDAPSHAITDAEWTALCFAAEAGLNTLGKKLGDVLSFRGSSRMDAADQVLDRAIHLKDLGKLENSDTWAIAILEHADLLNERSKPGGMFGTKTVSDSKIKNFIRSTARSLDTSHRKQLLGTFFRNPKTVSAVAGLLREQYFAIRGDDDNHRDKAYLDDDELSEILEWQLDQYRSMSRSDFIQLSQPYNVLYAWKNFTDSYDEPAKFLSKCFSDDEGIVDTLESLRYVYSSAQNGVSGVPEKMLRDFIDTDNIKSRLKTIASSKSHLAKRASELLNTWYSDLD
jgi:hypothetical protein